jgi:predicted NUDIX family NTP pyrophosphohydrolase
MYRQAGSELEVLLAHPGGPCRRHKDDGAWSIPKGEMNDGEHAEIAARREFLEEIGSDHTGPLEPLGDIRLRERGLRPPGRQGQARWAKNAGRVVARIKAGLRPAPLHVFGL